MPDIKKRVTTISEIARTQLQITRDEYALCSYVHYRSADSRQKMPGWCCDSKDDVAEFIGISRPGLYKMAQRLEAKGLLEVGNIGAMRTTPLWIDTESECKQSLQNGKNKNVNKVYSERKQSLQNKAKNVNLVNEVYNSKSKRKSKEEEEEKASAAAGNSPTLKEGKKETPPPPTPAAPLALSGFIDPMAEADRMRTDEAAREVFTRTRRLPADLYDIYLKDFALEVSATQEPHFGVAKFRNHFYNWSEKRYKIAGERTATPAPGKSSLPSNIPVFG